MFLEKLRDEGNNSESCLGPDGGTCLTAGRLVDSHIEEMFYVYGIASQSRNYIYVGLTDNIDRRLNEHNSGKNKKTKPYRPFKLIYTEVFETRIEARDREKKLKSGYGKEFLRKLRDEGYNG